ncbi:hypothetical protein BREVNS_0550 [Brevinematales bacterium NS]|nr:hypothetical protein BREVNS_0550 [Brevinematales bacterium NS]
MLWCFSFFPHKRKRHFSSHINASVTVVALVAVTLLFLLSMVMTVMVETGFLETQRSVQKIRSRWFLEGEVAKWFLQWENGELPPVGKRDIVLSSLLSGELVWEVKSTNWTLVGKAGKGISSSEIHLEGITFPLFATTLFWLHPVKIRLHAPWEIHGNLAISPGSEVITNTYTWKVQKEVIVGERGEDVQLPLEKKVVLPELWQRKGDVSSLWERAKRMAKDPWVITREAAYPVQEIVNPLHQEKMLLGRGRTQFGLFFRWQNRIGVYIRGKRSTNNNWQEFLYYRGPQRENVFDVDEDNVLQLRLSKNPYLRESSLVVELPVEAWERLGEILLEGKDVSLISRDEDVWGFQVGGRYYIAESDFVYERTHKTIRITSGEFFRRHVVDVAIANGVSREYTLPGGRGNIMVYVDGSRVWNYRRTQTRVIFDTPPPAGSRIQILRGVEDFVLYKKPPSSEEGIFVDKVERCVVLDLDTLENFPENGTIYTTLPLVIRGTAREPLAIVGEASLYLENINPQGGAAVLVASRTGVWLLQSDSFPRTLRHVAMISPLAGLYTVGEPFVPATVEGLGIFAAFGPVEGLDGFMEHVFLSSSLRQEDIPLLRQLPRPLFVRRLWRR